MKVNEEDGLVLAKERKEEGNPCQVAQLALATFQLQFTTNIRHWITG